MKKYVAILLSTTLLFAFSACGNHTQPPADTTVSQTAANDGTAPTAEAPAAAEPVSIGNTITLPFAELKLLSMLLVLFMVRRWKMNIYKIIVPANFIVKHGAVFEIFQIQSVVPDNAPGFADTHQRTGGNHFRMFKTM